AGSSKAFEALQDCAERHLGRQFPKQSSGLPSSSDSPDSSTAVGNSLEDRIINSSTAAIKAMLIGETPLHEAHLLGVAVMLEAVPGNGDAVHWALPKGRFVLVLLKEEPGTPRDAYLSKVANDLQGACANQAKIERLDGPDLGQDRLRVYCRDKAVMFMT